MANTRPCRLCECLISDVGPTCTSDLSITQRNIYSRCRREKVMNLINVFLSLCVFLLLSLPLSLCVCVKMTSQFINELKFDVSSSSRSITLVSTSAHTAEYFSLLLCVSLSVRLSSSVERKHSMSPASASELH